MVLDTPARSAGAALWVRLREGAMLSQPEQEMRRWPLGGDEVDQGYAALLDALTRDRLAADAVEREANATSRVSEAELQDEHAQVTRSELSEARRDVGA